MKPSDIETIEIELLLEAIFRRYGYDFRRYARASIRRRIERVRALVDAPTIADLVPMVLHDESLCNRMVREFSITVTEMFRDPEVYLALREQVVPLLKSYPYVKIWLAGCATGEEAYSLAILMEEEGLGGRATFFATDFNETALEKAREGIYSLENARLFTSNYQRAGGTSSFSDYYHARYDALAIRGALKEQITFANHNLVTDQVFSETHLIFCRNVMIYFNKELQNRVLRLFHDSLVHGGFLCLGKKESILFSGLEERFREIDSSSNIYQKSVG